MQCLQYSVTWKRLSFDIVKPCPNNSWKKQKKNQKQEDKGGCNEMLVKIQKFSSSIELLCPNHLLLNEGRFPSRHKFAFSKYTIFLVLFSVKKPKFVWLFCHRVRPRGYVCIYLVLHTIAEIESHVFETAAKICFCFRPLTFFILYVTYPCGLFSLDISSVGK